MASDVTTAADVLLWALGGAAAGLLVIAVVGVVLAALHDWRGR